jgi:hypothetical protein
MRWTRHLWVRLPALLALGAVGTALVLQVTAGPAADLGENVNSTTLFLLLFAVLLLFVAVAPAASTELLRRITTLKLPGGLEVGLQAAARVERVEDRVPERIEQADEVTTSPIPQDGGPRGEYEAVRTELEAKLRFVYQTVLDTGKEIRDYRKIIKRIEAERLLASDELKVVSDILRGEVEEELLSLPAEIRDEYLASSWRFAVRFGTLCFERLVRRKLAEEGWFLLDFGQAKSHRPDFLAHYQDDANGGERWRMIAARVEPRETRATRRRLLEQGKPFGAEPVLVVPNRRPFTPDDEYEIDVMTLKDFIERRGVAPTAIEGRAQPPG